MMGGQGGPCGVSSKTRGLVWDGLRGLGIEWG